MYKATKCLLYYLASKGLAFNRDTIKDLYFNQKYNLNK